MRCHHKNTCPLGGSEIKILKANGGAKEKGHASISNKCIRAIALSLHGILC